MRHSTFTTAAAMLGIALSGTAMAQMGNQGQQGQRGYQDSGYQQDQYRQQQRGYDSQQQNRRYDQTQGSQKNWSDSSEQQTQSRWPHSEARVQRASELLGSKVRNWNNEELGEVTDLVINRSQGQVIYAAVSRGGFMGVGDTLHAVPFDALRLSADGQYFILDVPERRFENANGFEDDNWPARGDASLLSVAQRQQLNNQGQQNQRYQQNQFQDQDSSRYNQRYNNQQNRSQSYDSRRGNWDQNPSQSQAQGPSGRDMNTTDYHMLGEGGPGEYPYVFDNDGYVNRDQNRRENDLTYDTRDNNRRFNEQNQRSQNWSQRQQRMTANQQTFQQQGQQDRQAQSVDWLGNDDLRWSNRVSQLLGTDLQDQQGRDIGEIDDIAIDLREGRIAFVVIDADDIGGDDRLVAMPWKAIEFDANNESYAINVDRQTLASAPSFQENNWPNLADSRFINSVYNAFGVEPYFTTYGYTVYDLNDLNPRSGQDQRQYNQNQQQLNQNQRQWGSQAQADHRYMQQFKQGQQRTLSGEIQRIVAVTPQQGMGRVLAIEVGDQRQGATLVHLGPINQVRDVLQIRRGEQIQVTGAQTQINNQNVVIARQVTLNGRTIQLRDQSGTPLYQQPQQRYQSNTNFDSDNQQGQRFRQDSSEFRNQDQRQNQNWNQ